MYYQDYAGKYGSTRFDSIDFHSRNYMIHHRFEKYNPVVWIGRKELTTPRADISGMHVFVFQPEKRQEEARKLCQA